MQQEKRMQSDQRTGIDLSTMSRRNLVTGYQDLRRKVNVLERQLRGQHVQNGHQASKIQDLTLTCEDQKRQLSHQKTLKKKYLKGEKAARRKLRMADHQDDLSAELLAERKENQRLVEELARLRASHRQARVNVTDLECELKKERKAHAQTVANNTSAINAVKAEMQALRQKSAMELKELQQQIAAKDRLVSELTAELFGQLGNRFMDLRLVD